MGMICVGDKKIADTTPDLAPYALQENVDNEFGNVVYKTDISKNITSDSTDAQVASAKAVFAGLANKPEIDDNDAGESELTVWSAKKTNGKIAEVETELGEKVDYKVVVEDGTRYVEDVVTQDINTWLPNDNSSIVINLKKTNGINYLNFQLLCNKKDSKNWSCIVNGAANELWKIRYIDGVRYIDELATMDKVVKYPDWSNQQTISQTEIAVDQDVYIELNQLTSSPIETLKINGKDVSISDAQNGLYSTRFSGYVKKGSFVSYPYLTNPKIVRVFPLV